MYKAVIQPILTYGCFTIKLKSNDIDDLEKVQASLIKAALGLSKYSRNTPILRALNIKKIGRILDERHLSLTRAALHNTSKSRTLYLHIIISSRSAATSLGCILDSKLNMSQQVSRVCKSANYYLHCIRKIRNFISMDACKLLVHTLVMVRLDYCNALLCGAREDVIRQLERLQRQAARVVCKKYKNDHTSVTELMWGLHWLPIRARIQYKILLLVYKAFTNGSPTYLADMMTSCNPVRSTRSSHKVNLLVVPHQKLNKYSEKAFAVVGHRLWNELLADELRGCNSVDTFKKKLKTMLFKKHY